MNVNQPIGIFDSGVGGLTVLRALIDSHPNESFVYLGDTARVPYGNKSANTVARYALNAGQFLINENVKSIVVACNTASAFAIDDMRAQFAVPIIGVIEPVAKIAARGTGSIAVIGTRGTVQSGAYLRELAKHDRHNVVQLACPLLVPLAEENWLDGAAVDEIISHYFSKIESDVDTMILGCTHYPLLREAIQRNADNRWGKKVTLLDCASATAKAIVSDESEKDGANRYYVTDQPAGFTRVAERFLGYAVEKVEHVDLPTVY